MLPLLQAGCKLAGTCCAMSTILPCNLIHESQWMIPESLLTTTCSSASPFHYHTCSSSRGSSLACRESRSTLLDTKPVVRAMIVPSQRRTLSDMVKPHCCNDRGVSLTALQLNGHSHTKRLVGAADFPSLP